MKNIPKNTTFSTNTSLPNTKNNNPNNNNKPIYFSEQPKQPKEPSAPNKKTSIKKISETQKKPPFPPNEEHITEHMMLVVLSAINIIRKEQGSLTPEMEQLEQTISQKLGETFIIENEI
ncbi:MAG: hypothetical protein E6Q89_04080, partial [Bacteroidia bacterium]